MVKKREQYFLMKGVKVCVLMNCFLFNFYTDTTVHKCTLIQFLKEDFSFERDTFTFL